MFFYNSPVDMKCYTFTMRLLWWDLVKHVKTPEVEPEAVSVEEEVGEVDVVAEALDAFSEEIRKLRRDVDRIDRAKYRAAEKGEPPADTEVPLVEPPPPPAAEQDLATVINNLRPGQPIPAEYHHLIH